MRQIAVVGLCSNLWHPRPRLARWLAPVRKRPEGLHRAAARLRQRVGGAPHRAHAFGLARAHACHRTPSGTPAARLDSAQRAARARPRPADVRPPPTFTTATFAAASAYA